MIVHYRMNNMGWLDSHKMDLDNLWLKYWMYGQFHVSTEEEFDFLEGYGLIKGHQLNVKWNPTLGNISPLGTCLWLKDINTNTFNPRIRSHHTRH